MASRSEVGTDNTDGNEAQPQAGPGPNRIAEKRSVALAVPFYALMAYLRRRNSN
jgi:hypothetical protein